MMGVEPAGTPELRHIEALVCEACLNGEPDECHTPGCAFWMCPSVNAEQGERLRNCVVVVDAARRIEKLETELGREKSHAQEMERQRNAFGEALTRAANGEPAADAAAQAMQDLAAGTDPRGEWHEHDCGPLYGAYPHRHPTVPETKR